MTKEEKIDLVERRIRFLSVWKKVSNRRKAFKPMEKIFNLLEADYDKCIIPDEKERIYRHFKSSEKIVSSKLGKYLVRNYKDLVPKDHILTDFVASLNAIVWKTPPSINIYKGDDILTAFKRCHKFKPISSCMTFPNRNHYMKILAQNPNKVAMHCLEDAESIYARALVWTLDNGDQIVDRIYPNNGVDFHTFLDFHSERGYFIRKSHGIIETKSKTPIQIKGKHIVDIELDCTGITTYPYLDTFRFGVKQDDNKLIVSNAFKINTQYQLDSSSGKLNTIE